MLISSPFLLLDSLGLYNPSLIPTLGFRPLSGGLHRRNRFQAPNLHAHTSGRYQTKRFRKAQCPIVERLTNSLMMHWRNNGKELMVVRIVNHAMEIIHLLTDANPIQIIVDAVINREYATRIGSAGVVRRHAVDISPLRRVNQAIYLLTTGARESAFRNVKTIVECLPEKLINAAEGSSNRFWKCNGT